ncbi:MAG: ribose 5-phosphate isomerase B [Alphaproteobacteria bacterium]
MNAGTGSVKAIAIASDHAGYVLKADIAGFLTEQGYSVVDLGTDGPDSVDYPDFADALVQALADDRAGRGILICGTGIGISIAANRYRHIRAAHCHDTTDARLSRQHNDANVIALGARTLGPELARDCVTVFLATAFEGDSNPRHARRIVKMS